MSSTIDKDKLTEKLKGRMSNVEPLPDEPDFFYTKETLTRFLKARDWDLHEAEKQLKAAVEWRRQYRPLKVDCKWCHEKPGYHSMRQVGFDVLRRPVIYASFVQAQTHKNSSEDSLAHCVYLIENAKRSMEPGVSTWVFVLDCTGVTLPCCNPAVGKVVAQVLGGHYPERLGKVVCINHGSVFHGIWNATKVFIDEQTVKKVKLIRTREKMVKHFGAMFPEELSDWLLEEVRLNSATPFPEEQRTFWQSPDDILLVEQRHDPRGSPSYVSVHVDPVNTRNSPEVALHRVHPNIIDVNAGTLCSVPVAALKTGDTSSFLSLPTRLKGAFFRSSSASSLELRVSANKEVSIQKPSISSSVNDINGDSK